MGREDNIRIFHETEKLCKENLRLSEAISKSVKAQIVVSEKDVLADVEKKIYKDPAEIVISQKRSLEAASEYPLNKVCVHNFASASNPGGGVTRGSNAQEECLCRCSSLYFCLNTKRMWEQFYAPHRAMHNPIHNDDIIYTPSVVVFKTDTAEPKLLQEKDWYKVNMITCAAPNLRNRPSNAYNTGDGKVSVNVTDKELFDIHVKRLRRILDVALVNGNEVVILGAFGCGAFTNNPEVVAEAAKKVIKEYRQAFVAIEFAIYCSPWDSENYKIFKRVLGDIVEEERDKK